MSDSREGSAVPEDVLQICNMLDFQRGMESKSNKEIAALLLKDGPVFGRYAFIVEEAAERLSPGIIEELGGLPKEDEDGSDR